MFFHAAHDGVPYLIQILFHISHFVVDRIRELFEPFASFLRLLMHLLLENQSHLRLVYAFLFLSNLVVLLFPLLFLLFEILDLSDVGAHFFLQFGQFVLFSKSYCIYRMKESESSSIYLLFFSRAFVRFSHSFCLLLIT